MENLESCMSSVALLDGRWLFLSSANLTEYAFTLNNGTWPADHGGFYLSKSRSTLIR